LTINRWGLVVAAIVSGLGLAGWFYASYSTVAGADAKDDALVALGGDIYARNCASCHGAKLEGQKDWRVRDAAGYLPAPPHDETGHTWHHGDEMLFKITKFGTASLIPGSYKTNMNGFGETLSDREIWAALAFIKSQWPERIQKRQAAIK